jgi:hypothetical protein
MQKEREELLTALTRYTLIQDYVKQLSGLASKAEMESLGTHIANYIQQAFEAIDATEPKLVTALEQAWLTLNAGGTVKVVLYAGTIEFYEGQSGQYRFSIRIPDTSGPYPTSFVARKFVEGFLELYQDHIVHV